MKLYEISSRNCANCAGAQFDAADRFDAGWPSRGRYAVAVGGRNVIYVNNGDRDS